MSGQLALLRAAAGADVDGNEAPLVYCEGSGLVDFPLVAADSAKSLAGSNLAPITTAALGKRNDLRHGAIVTGAPSGSLLTLDNDGVGGKAFCLPCARQRAGLVKTGKRA